MLDAARCAAATKAAAGRARLAADTTHLAATSSVCASASALLQAHSLEVVQICDNPL